MTPIVFAYKNAAVEIECSGPLLPAPTPEIRSLFRGVAAESVLPGDRIYLSLFYNRLAKMVIDDRKRLSPVFRTVGHFAALHGRSLASSPAASLDRLLDSIDLALVRMLGPSGDSSMQHSRAATACAALAWRFAIHGDD